MFTFDHDDITRKSSFQKRKEKVKYSEYRKRLAEKFNILEKQQKNEPANNI